MIIKFIRTAFIAVILFSTISSFAADQLPSKPIELCQSQAPYGYPQTDKANMVLICRTAYALLHDNNAKVPAWVVYTLTPNHAIGCAIRSNAFAADQSIPRGQRAELIDYAKSGFDTGHMANSADMSWNPAVERESYILSNMAPQLPNLNRGLWKDLETVIRTWVFNSNHDVTVYVGSIYDLQNDRRIGPSGVIVPRGFYKIIIDNTTKQTLAFLFPHKNTAGMTLEQVQVTVADIEIETGIMFPVPEPKTIKNPIWQSNFNALLNGKKQICGARVQP